ncbi:uncharacterized protein LOC134469129 [Engraulis encrasicolus]|uniref:uncharacterized protein LOC134469129 n=1 Tax=Engraulis encrasicolus TaxID=184585 RepID=UPI002FD5EEF9
MMVVVPPISALKEDECAASEESSFNRTKEHLLQLLLRRLRLRMKTATVVLLLLWSCQAVTVTRSQDLRTTSLGTPHRDPHSSPPQPDIHTVLEEMSTLIIEQAVQLRHTKTQLEALEKKAEGMENRLRASENLIDQLKTVTDVQTVNLGLTLRSVSALRRERDESRVSFSASLLQEGGGYTGPSQVETPLVFRNIIANIGDAYSAKTGVFTAPTRGAYFFIVFASGHGHTSIPTGVTLWKNRELVVSAFARQEHGDMSASNGASLQLEAGDEICVKLWHDARVFDNHSKHTTFSGHLLFAM